MRLPVRAADHAHGRDPDDPLGLLVLCAGYVWWRERPPLPARSLLIAMAAWAGIAIASLLWSVDFEYSQGEVRNEVVYPLLAFFAFYALTPDEARWRLWVRVVAVSAALIAVYAFANFVRHADWYTKAYIGDRNAYSTYATLVAPMLLAAALDRALGGAMACRRRHRARAHARRWRAHAEPGDVGGAARRGAGAACDALPLAHGDPRRADGGGRRRARVYVGRGRVHRDSEPPENVRAGPGASLGAQFEADPRLKIWAYAAERIGERPWLGYGYGRGILRKDFRAKFEGNLLHWHGHNLFLNAAMGGGMLLVVALTALLGALAYALAREARASPVCAMALAVLAAAVVKSLTDDVLIRENSLLLWSLAGMALGVARASQLSPR